ncbi:MAG: recombination protein NinB [Gallionella sp.]|nr:recombination protein NinB [Gallionella sp.]
MDRPAFKTRTIRLIGQSQRDIALAAVTNAPLDPDKPIEVVIREERKTRKLDQNAAYHAGPLRDIAEQAWIDGKQYSAEVWHEYFKREYLPEDGKYGDLDIELLAKEGYRKWASDPAGERVLIGSTTQLTVRGMAQYMQQVEAHGASLGVQFHEAPIRWESESARHA